MSRGSFVSIAIATLLLALLSSCKQKTKFHADIDFDGLGSQKVTVVYRGVDGVTVEELAVVDSKLSLVGHVAAPSVIEIYGRNQQLLGLFVAAPNEKKITVKFKVNKPLWLQATGNVVSESLSRFAKDNEKILTYGNEKLNEAVATYIKKNPSDPASAVLLAYYYDATENERQAKELFKLLSGDASSLPLTDMMRPFYDAPPSMSEGKAMPSIKMIGTNDTVQTFAAERGKRYLYSFEDKTAVDSAKNAEIEQANVNLVDIRMRPDTSGWRRNIIPKLPSSAKAFHAPTVLLDSAVSALGVNAIPYYIAVDTAGIQVYRGMDMKKALKHLKND